jgi:hypothetical protein
LPYPADAHASPIVQRLGHLSEEMFQLHRFMRTARISQEQTSLQRRIEATDQRIDRLVYQLYGLTAEDISLVENVPR